VPCGTAGKRKDAPKTPTRCTMDRTRPQRTCHWNRQDATIRLLEDELWKVNIPGERLVICTWITLSKSRSNRRDQSRVAASTDFDTDYIRPTACGVDHESDVRHELRGACDGEASNYYGRGGYLLRTELAEHGSVRSYYLNTPQAGDRLHKNEAEVF
jgi:hypothetical protein